MYDVAASARARFGEHSNPATKTLFEKAMIDELCDELFAASWERMVLLAMLDHWGEYDHVDVAAVAADVWPEDYSAWTFKVRGDAGVWPWRERYVG